MACATLKRSLEWDSINQRPIKRRRRCNPFTPSGASGSSSLPSVAQDVAEQSNLPLPSNTFLRDPESVNPFEEIYMSKISPEKMSEDIREEIKRLQRCRLLPFTSAAIEHMQDSESSGSEMGADSPTRPDSPFYMDRIPDKALFTFKQVQLICYRMLKEREEEMRDTYDAVLTTKLAEQYDAFVKFTYDQIQRRFEAAPSYLS